MHNILKNIPLKKTASVITNAVSVAVTVLFAAIAIFLLYSMFAAKDEQGNISLGPYEYMTVATGSMEPAISAGDVIVIKKGAPEAVALNDVITFYPYEGSLTRVTHRVVAIAQEGFLTQGDANSERDENPVTHLMYIGKVILTIPFIGKLMSKPSGLMVLAGAFLVYALAEALLKEFFKNKFSRKAKEQAAVDESTEAETEIAAKVETAVVQTPPEAAIHAEIETNAEAEAEIKAQEIIVEEADAEEELIAAAPKEKDAGAEEESPSAASDETADGVGGALLSELLAQEVPPEIAAIRFRPMRSDADIQTDIEKGVDEIFRDVRQTLLDSRPNARNAGRPGSGGEGSATP